MAHKRYQILEKTRELTEIGVHVGVITVADTASSAIRNSGEDTVVHVGSNSGGASAPGSAEANVNADRRQGGGHRRRARQLPVAGVGGLGGEVETVEDTRGGGGAGCTNSIGWHKGKVARQLLVGCTSAPA